MYIFVSVTDTEFLRENCDKLPMVNCFETERAGHKFSVGDVRILTGLVDFPEFNGEEVEIVGYRMREDAGNTYYVKGRINEYLNWVYEHRLK